MSRSQFTDAMPALILNLKVTHTFYTLQIANHKAATRLFKGKRVPYPYEYQHTKLIIMIAKKSKFGILT